MTEDKTRITSELSRELSLFHITMMGLGMMIGAGVFLGIGNAVHVAGPGGVLLTFALNGRFKEFRSDIGIASRMGARGSVVFTVLGDGRPLYKSPVMKGTGQRPTHVKVSVAGVRKLTLKVTNAGDLDLGDVANWGAARMLR